MWACVGIGGCVGVHAHEHVYSGWALCDPMAHPGPPPPAPGRVPSAADQTTTGGLGGGWAAPRSPSWALWDGQLGGGSHDQKRTMLNPFCSNYIILKKKIQMFTIFEKTCDFFLLPKTVIRIVSNVGALWYP